MMNRLLKIFLILFCQFSFSQITNTQKTIDSLISKKVSLYKTNFDSLANPKLLEVPIIKKDSIILPHIRAESTRKEVPVTPYIAITSSSDKQWFYYGQNNLTINQNNFSHWNAGGSNSFGLDAKVNYTLIYKSGKNFWENNAQLGYGVMSIVHRKDQKTDDVINISSTYGYDLGKNYYLSTGFQFLSQFSPGYDYSGNSSPEFSDRISNFMAPAYLNMGIGLLYNPNENFQITVRPINGRFTFVLDKKFQKIGQFGLVRDGQKVRVELGNMINISYKIKLMKDMTFTNQLDIFSNYFNHPERANLAYSGILNLKFNKYISTLINLDLVYNHDQIDKLQLKQTLGVGLSYNLGMDSAKKPQHKNVLVPYIK